RRRHTRSDRDWSSDVCSSDLENRIEIGSAAQCPDTVVAGNIQAAGSRIDGVGEILCCLGARSDVAKYRSDTVGVEKTSDGDAVIESDVVEITGESQIVDRRDGETGAEVPRRFGPQWTRTERTRFAGVD